MKHSYKGPERRQFLRLDYVTPLAYKVCKKETIRKILQGYVSDISQTGVLCNIGHKVNKDDILWLSFDRSTLSICKDLERNSLIYQNGVVGKVIRVEHKPDNTYNVGVRFITREEENLTNIHPKIYFVKDISEISEEAEEDEDQELQENNEGDENQEEQDEDL